MSDPREFNRLRWRCRRGMRELDTLLMRFVDERYETASAEEQAAFRDFLAHPDPEILDLLTGRLQSEDPALKRIVSLVLEQRLS